MFHNQRNPRGAYNLAIVEISRERRIGWIGWGRSEDPTHGEYSFGYALLPPYWGQGYMTEALRAGVAFIFEALGAQGISDYCETTNIGSMRVMQKAGLTEVARRQEESIEYVRYAIRKEEWTKSVDPA
jgi:RimJ/RimL family protein N-acetyltransferase